ncbi:MAG: SigB/SigF/SigG family RNA polymerase sigma factor [Clostridia bacterium]|nr:SigB/SigF/SigG family RNA polymerase sigma factor [Clostridia bacterium]
MNELIWQAQSGNKEAMSRLIDENIGLVWNIVKRFNNRGYELEDLFQIGCMGFVKAIQRFNTEYETQLSTYAVPMIIGEIKRFLRDNGPIKVSRSLKELAMKVRQLQEENTAKLGDELSIHELANKLGVSKEEVVAALDATSYIESLDRQAYEDDETTIGERIVCEDKEYHNLLDKITIESMISRLTDKEKRVIIYRYYKEKTQTEISHLLGISQVQVSRIEKRALEKMRA